MLGNYGLDDEEALLDALAKRRMMDAKGIPDGTTGPAPEVDTPDIPDDPFAKLPDLTPLPPRVDLTDARAKDAQSRSARGFETAARQAIGGLTLTKPADTITPEGTAEQAALADESRARGDVLETRKAQMLDRQKALAALLRPPAKAPVVKPLTPVNAEMEAAKVDKLKAEAEKLRRPAPVRPPKAPAPVALPDEVRTESAVLRFVGDPNTSKEMKLLNGRIVRESAAKWNTTVASLSKLEDMMTEFVKNPTPQNRAKLYGPALSAAGATNAAIGQGAMSDAEKQAQFQALGVNMGDAAGLQSLMERAFGDPAAAGDMVQRIRNMKDLARKSVAAQAQPYGYDVVGAAPPASQPPTRKIATNPKTGERRYINADGSLGEPVK